MFTGIVEEIGSKTNVYPINYNRTCKLTLKLKPSLGLRMMPPPVAR